MEYIALFLWLSLCMLLGGLMHSIMASVMQHRGITILAAPGLVVRKFAMTLTALVCGGTVTRVRIYELSSREIDYRADGMASVAKTLVPLAPLFAGAVAMVSINGTFGGPLALQYSVPSLSSLSAPSLQSYFTQTWGMLSSIVRQCIKADWGAPMTFILFALTYSLSLGACEPAERVKQAILGAGLLSVFLALLSSIAVRRAEVIAASPPLFITVREFIFSTAAVAFAMMVYGLFAAILVGFAVRLYEMVNRGSGGKKSSGRTARLEEVELDRAA